MDKTAEKIKVYGENFSLSQLREYEDAIYTDKIDSVKRCHLELERLETDLRKKGQYYTYLKEIMEMKKLLRVAYFDDTVVDDIKKTIVRIQLEEDFSVRLYSAVAALYAESQKEKRWFVWL